MGVNDSISSSRLGDEVTSEKRNVLTEGAAVVDGEEEDDVAAGVVGVGEEGEVFLLGGPGAVTLCDFHILNVPTFDHEVSGI